MEVILQQDVDKLGKMGEVVRVKPGYARNYLLPRGLALLADSKNLRVLEHQKRMVASRRAKVKKAAEDVAQTLANVAIEIPARAGEEDRLFGSVTNIDVQAKLAERGFDVDRKKILLESPIKALGQYSVPLNLGPDVRVEIKVTVVREE
ncbi:MAG: large subunit ribosomal protein [Candidatus Binatota bacterium]|nr:large subunit ribosomal protein [Candidatus Binatota bacterium]